METKGQDGRDMLYRAENIQTFPISGLALSVQRLHRVQLFTEVCNVSFQLLKALCNLCRDLLFARNIARGA
jgi:hypothetical protein